jgi:hypothetical protein|tara:strand:- start:330 stop:950 length:621 start_codon:yes stop_codon:yes gene_type:complete
MGIETKLAVGEFIQLPKGSSPVRNGVISEGCAEHSIQISQKVKGYDAKTRQIQEGFNAKTKKSHRNFVWLPWMVNAVNFTDQGGKDVLSGRFSGCYMIRYKMPGGSWRVAHVHTPEGIDAWNELAQTPGFEISCGFKPFVAAKAKELGSNAHTYGIITDTGLCHRLIVKETRWDFSKGEADIYNEIIEISSVATLSPEQLRVLVPL